MKKMRALLITSIDSIEYIQALQVRREVFIEEQKVPESLEIDEYEKNCQHFLLMKEAEAAATGRLRIKENYIKFERIATLKKFRGQGLGSQLMQDMLSFARHHYPQLIPYMHSQLSAQTFYEKLGWTPVGEVFYEANIPHRVMKMSAPQSAFSP